MHVITAPAASWDCQPSCRGPGEHLDFRIQQAQENRATGSCTSQRDPQDLKTQQNLFQGASKPNLNIRDRLQGNM